MEIARPPLQPAHFGRFPARKMFLVEKVHQASRDSGASRAARIWQFRWRCLAFEGSCALPRSRHLKQVVVKPGGSLGVQCEQSLAQCMTAIVLLTPGLFENGNSRALGEPTHRRGKIQVFVVHYETENRPAGTAAEAMIGLTLRVDVKGGRFFPMKRAERSPARPGALKRKIRSDDLDNIISFGHTLDGFLREARRPKYAINLAREVICDAISFGLISGIHFGLRLSNR